jgi:galactose mutarotase-like enzyme
LIELDNGALQLDILPTRGMGIWRARAAGMTIGWRSPVTDGPIHPALVPLDAWGGLGWLDGFDELLARCGLETNGPPFREGDRTQTLHGRIANLPAHRAAIQVGQDAPHVVSVVGEVDETRLFAAQLRLNTRISTRPGALSFTVRDEVTNLKDQPFGFELLYHWNFGPPLLEEGARFRAPVRTICPRTDHAAAGLNEYDRYGAPTPGVAEEVFFFELWGTGERGQTLAVLHNRAADLGIALRFAIAELPCFVLWKNLGGMADGYVTGLEPSLNYPNAKPYELKHDRVRMLAPGESHVMETTFELLIGEGAVGAAVAEIETIQRQGSPTCHARPIEPFVAP